MHLFDSYAMLALCRLVPMNDFRLTVEAVLIHPRCVDCGTCLFCDDPHRCPAEKPQSTDVSELLLSNSTMAPRRDISRQTSAQSQPR